MPQRAYPRFQVRVLAARSLRTVAHCYGCLAVVLWTRRPFSELGYAQRWLSPRTTHGKAHMKRMCGCACDQCVCYAEWLVHDTFTRYLVTSSIANLARCAVAVLPSQLAGATSSDADMLSSIRAWNPWILPGPLPRWDPSPGLKPRDAVEQLRQHPVHFAVVANLTRLEQQVYDAGVWVHRQQVQRWRAKD